MRVGVPLLRLDFGVLYNKYYGETERNLRKALETAELMSPCVLWMDEIEKGVAVGATDDRHALPNLRPTAPRGPRGGPSVPAVLQRSLPAD